MASSARWRPTSGPWKGGGGPIPQLVGTGWSMNRGRYGWGDSAVCGGLPVCGHRRFGGGTAVCRFELLLVCCWGGGALFTVIFALGLWLLESAKESDRLPQTSLAFLDFSATGEWHPARPVAVVGASALHPEVAWSSYCCWSAVGGLVAAGGLVAVVVPVCGVDVWGGSARSQR